MQSDREQADELSRTDTATIDLINRVARRRPMPTFSRVADATGWEGEDYALEGLGIPRHVIYYWPRDFGQGKPGEWTADQLRKMFERSPRGSHATLDWEKWTEWTIAEHVIGLLQCRAVRPDMTFSVWGILPNFRTEHYNALEPLVDALCASWYTGPHMRHNETRFKAARAITDKPIIGAIWMGTQFPSWRDASWAEGEYALWGVLHYAHSVILWGEPMPTPQRYTSRQSDADLQHFGARMLEVAHEQPSFVKPYTPEELAQMRQATAT